MSHRSLLEARVCAHGHRLGSGRFHGGQPSSQDLASAHPITLLNATECRRGHQAHTSSASARHVLAASNSVKTSGQHSVLHVTPVTEVHSCHVRAATCLLHWGAAPQSLLLLLLTPADDHPVFSNNSGPPRHFVRNYSTEVIAEKAVAQIKKAAKLARQGIPFHLSVAPTA